MDTLVMAVPSCGFIIIQLEDISLRPRERYKTFTVVLSEHLHVYLAESFSLFDDISKNFPEANNLISRPALSTYSVDVGSANVTYTTLLMYNLPNTKQLLGHFTLLVRNNKYLCFSLSLSLTK